MTMTSADAAARSCAGGLHSSHILEWRKAAEAAEACAASALATKARDRRHREIEQLPIRAEG